MKNLYLFVLLFSFTVFGYSQPYGNEWINYSQQYYKFPVVKTGLYRIDSATLATAGIPISGINPKNIQIFGRGEELYLYINGESDGVLNTSDYIEFYAQHNDGYLDSLVYQNKSAGHSNPYYSLFNDTAFYFITWNNSTNNKRYIVEADTAFAAFTPANYFLKEQTLMYPSNYYTGETFGGINVTDPEFTPTEGWFDNAVGLGGIRAYTFLAAGVYTAGPVTTATVMVRVAGESNFAFLNPDHHLRISMGSYVKDTIYEGYKLNKFNFQLPATDLSTSSIPLYIESVNDLGNPSNPDNNSLVFAYLKYPHIIDMEGTSSFEFLLPDNPSQGKAYLNMSNFNNLGAGVRFYDLTNHRFIPVSKNGVLHRALIPNASNEKKCFITSVANIINISSIKPAGNNGVFTDFSNNSPDSAFIIISHKKLMTEANNYKTYRSGIAGGSHNVVLADIDELYEQFSFGVNKHPLAIRRFCDFALDTWPSPPQNLLLIGKSLHVTRYRRNPGEYANTLVPSMGYPSCDNLFTAGLNGTLLEPAIPTGRIAAKTGNDVTIYLDKVIEFEGNVPEAWMKNVLHFGGGTSSSEQQTLKNYLKNYEDIIEDTLYGGMVHTFLKTSSAPIQINTSDSLKKLIEGGVSLMTFFGHASGTGFDQSIDHPSNYNNKGKYPLLLANSCFAGDLHGPAKSSSESFVLIKDKGVIGYIGSVSLGVVYALNNYSHAFYEHLSYKNYGKSIGKQMQLAVASSQAGGTDPFQKSVCLEMTLHGDPSVVLNAHEFPDYAITNADVSFDTKTYVDSFIVHANMTNIGHAVKDSFVVEIQRKFPNGDVESYLKRVNAPYYKGAVSFTIPVDFSRGLGLNKIKVTLDLYNEITELSELNNSTNPDIDLLLSGGVIVPVYPYEYAVIPTNTVTLIASTADPLATPRNYIFEIDTTDLFNSAFKISTTINSAGGAISWSPALTLPDSMVCFWRVSPDSIDSTGYRWRESSFQYIQGKRGWGQAHFFQFKNDNYQYVKHNRPSRSFIFVNDVKSIHARDGFFPITNFNEIKYGINSANYHPWGCAWGGFNFAWINPVSGSYVPSINQGTGYGQYNNKHCVPENLEWFSFDSDSVQRHRMRDFIDSVPNGHYILAYSIDFNGVDIKTAILNDTLTYSAFEKFGSGNIRTLKDTVPYIIFGRKGDPIGSANESIGTSRYDFISLQDTITTKWKEGYIESEIIGPALNWGSLHWRQRALENPTKDSVVLNVIGITATGTEAVLATFPPDSMEVLNLGVYANASTYPYMKLKAYVKDDSLTTSPQITRWQVLYTPVPEAALNPPKAFSFHDDTLQEGETLKLIMAIENISEYTFTDSLLVTYWVLDNNRVKHNLPSALKASPFTAGAVIIDTVTFNTEGFTGNNSFWIEVNPVGQPKSQLEQYHFNNIAQLNFYVGNDEINPLLDVTFDGIHILNGDIVSPKPNITIQLKDENRFLALNDTSDFAVYLKKPGASIEERIYFGPEMIFTPAALPNNSCKINYTPQLPADGTYRLIVQAKDRSDNVSGLYDYKIDFEVINKSTITEVLNYPNPFSTSTKFVFTLTGSEIPSIFKIQILTVSGKVVREIMQDEIGPIHIGRNITQYAWDGKDQFGDQLANGIYLYRVVTQLNGQSIEKRESGADDFIIKGFGKMYLMR